MTSIRDHRSIVEAVFAHAVRTPEKTAVADPKGSCTYSRLREHVLHAYEVAVQNRYRFFSFGDAMFLS